MNSLRSRKIVPRKLYIRGFKKTCCSLLVVVGILWALVVDYGEISAFPKFEPQLFFHYLLPPIILEAAYSLYNKAFFDNLWTILLYAVVVSRDWS